MLTSRPPPLFNLILSRELKICKSYCKLYRFKGQVYPTISDVFLWIDWDRQVSSILQRKPLKYQYWITWEASYCTLICKLSLKHDSYFLDASCSWLDLTFFPPTGRSLKTKDGQPGSLEETANEVCGTVSSYLLCCITLKMLGNDF